MLYMEVTWQKISGKSPERVNWGVKYKLTPSGDVNNCVIYCLECGIAVIYY